MTTKAMTAQNEKANTVRAILEKMKPQFDLALPKHLTADRLLRVAMTAIQNTPKLLDCDRTSLFAALMDCAQLGLEPDGVLGHAYLVPYGRTVQFIPGYKGLIALARNSGDVSAISAHEVREKDHFDYTFGLDPKLEHKPADGERGEVTHFYAVAQFKDGSHHFEVMARAEVDLVRDESQGYKAFKVGKIKSNPWETHYVEMGKKTLIRRLAKYLPLNVQRASAIEDAYDRGHHSNLDLGGGIVIDGVAEETEDGAGEDAGVESAKAAAGKLDAFAGTKGERGAEAKREASPPKGQGESDGAPGSKTPTPAPASAKTEPHYRFLDPATGEIADYSRPADFIGTLENAINAEDADTGALWDANSAVVGRVVQVDSTLEQRCKAVADLAFQHQAG